MYRAPLPNLYDGVLSLRRESEQLSCVWAGLSCNFSAAQAMCAPTFGVNTHRSTQCPSLSSGPQPSPVATMWAPK